MLKRSIKNQSGSSVMILIVLVVLVAVVGVGYSVLKSSKKTATSPASTSKELVAETLEVKNRGTFALQKPESKTTFYEGVQDPTTFKFANTTDVYTSISHPDSWKVYKKDRYQTPNDPFAESMIAVPGGIYIHMYDQGGVGGGCTPNDIKFTLTKKLATSDPDLFFTQYKVDNSSPSVLALENFVTDNNSGYTKNDHTVLSEGQSSSNTCNIQFYSNSTKFTMVSINHSTTSELSSNITWDEIKGNTDLVKALQSLSTHTK